MSQKIKNPLSWNNLRQVISVPGRAVKSLNHSLVLGCSIGLALFTIGFLSIVFPLNSSVGVFLLDHNSNSFFIYPFTIQNLLIIFFYLGLGELALRWFTGRMEISQVGKNYLPEDDTTVLQARDLGPIRKKVAGQFDGDNGFLPYLIDLCILQFQASRSVDQTVSVLNSSLELINHRVDLRYSSIRYIVWAIPTIGFIGTVIGIAQSLGYINPDAMDLGLITGSLKIAFNTTILALLFSAILVWFQHVVQKREELSANFAGNYCLKNLINRLYVDQP